MILRFNLEPVPKGRPKTRFAHGKVWTFTPRATEEAQKAIVAQLPFGDIAFPQHKAIKVILTFYRKRSRWLKPKSKFPMPSVKPDIDNYAKLVIDAMNGKVFYDDGQITTLIVKKRWSRNGSGFVVCDIREDKE